MHRSGLIVLLVLAVFPPGTAAAQRPRAVGNGEVVVKVMMPGGRPVPAGTRVELRTLGSSYIGDGATDPTGTVTFVRVSPGTYSLRVTGQEVEETNSGTFIVTADEGVHFEYAEVKLRRAGPDPTRGTVSALDMKAPVKAREEFSKGNAAMQQHKWKDACNRYEKAIQLYPEYPSAYNNLGQAWASSGDDTKAREAFQKAISLDDKLIPAYVALARVQSRQQQYADAERLLTKALENSPQDVEALALLVNVKLQLGKIDEAIATARKVHLLPHASFEVVHLLCAQALEAKGLNREARAEYEAYLKESPNGKFVPQARGALARLSGN